jgi:hypothetical protein
VLFIESEYNQAVEINRILKNLFCVLLTLKWFLNQSPLCII